jgi:AAA domain
MYQSYDTTTLFIEGLGAMAGKVVAILNMKGGVGKTTVSAHVMRVFYHQLSKKVLLLDLDPQFNLTQCLMRRAEYDKVKRSTPVRRCRNTSKDEDPYGLPSTHVHGTAITAAPAVGEMATLAQREATCNDCVKLQRDIAEYLTDVFAAWYADRWHDFPDEIKAQLTVRLPGKLLSEFCS